LVSASPSRIVELFHFGVDLSYFLGGELTLGRRAAVDPA
jgi:hypothetical protein